MTPDQLELKPDVVRGRQRHESRQRRSSRPCSTAACVTNPARSGSRVTCCSEIAGCSLSRARTARRRPRACWPGFSNTPATHPGFLIGGVPLDFDVSARLGDGPPFVIEADEYDTAFFDKRAKFVHYRPRTAVLNNLEHDHADIYPDVASIQRQFHLLLRMVPAQRTPRRQCGRPHIERSARHGLLDAGRTLRLARHVAARLARAPPTRGGELCELRGLARRTARRPVDWDDARPAQRRECAGRLRARRIMRASPSRRRDRGAAPVQRRPRRLEVRGVVGGIAVYDDFAHHPTAIATTLRRLAARRGGGRVIAVLEPRSNTMKLGTHKAALADSLAGADRVFVYQSPEVKWDVADAMAPLGALATVQSRPAATGRRARGRSRARETTSCS